LAEYEIIRGNVDKFLKQHGGCSMVKAEVGMSMLYCLSDPFERMVKKIPEPETEYIEIVDDGLHVLDEQRVAILKDVGKSYGLKYTVHAPFAGVNIALSSKPLLNATLKRLKESILYAAALDCQIWVFHPGMRTGISSFYPGEDWRRNMESVRLLFHFAGDNGVNAVLENAMDPFVMRGVEDFKRFYAEVDEPVGLVLDTGHANITGELQGFLTELPDKIAHVHVHDNFGKGDQHLGIGYGNIDWKKTTDLLKKASYGGIVMVESVEHVQESVERMKHLLG
jgi:sugar phosphate isomerase/epimerase